ncbi:MAG: hypothetical protein LKG14_02455 [Prevotella sp.]|jgi:Leucine-rich repeat (LRR) protein|nr:hypothetical protein [Prevotella sp.]MCH3995589.1 hypothetical protein [Prevotella sp.]MCI1246236.1 hypothetical protein [Prevotella sp.]
MKFKKIILPLLAFCVLGLSSCSDDDGPSYSDTTLKNTELMTILKSKGYTFDEQGKLLLDEKAKSTTSLDLSGTKLSDLSGLDIFPNLVEVNLANNDYGPVFDFSVLPASVTSVDLRDNKIFDFEGLVKNESEDDEEIKTTILHPLTKLYLPATAKYNIEDLVPFYTTSTSTNMQMQDASGNLKAYTTLRDIPDEYFRNYLKGQFPTLFNGDQLDISKKMALAEQGKNIEMGFMTRPKDYDKIKSIEGVEYFINNPFYKTFFVGINCPAQCSISYIAPRSNVKALMLYNVDTSDGVDFSQATKLASIQFVNNNSLTTLDLSNTLCTNQKIANFDVLTSNALICKHCKNLAEIKFPNPSEGLASTLVFGDLPSLKKLDLSFVIGIQTLGLLQLQNCTITYPKLKYIVYNGQKLEDLSSGEKVDFAISEDIFNMNQTKTFITTYRKNLSDDYSSYDDLEGYRWSKYM